MIRIKKSAKPPEVLIKKGNKEKEKNIRLYDNAPIDYKTGKQKVTFDSSIYNHKTVKAQLVKDQAGKCCYCETRFKATSFGVTEHFRPKGCYASSKSSPKIYPGYYWKAYDWDNLLFSCEVCNTSYKKYYFPLEDEKCRAVSHHDDIAGEKPLLIHPGQEDPEPHLGFRSEVCFPKTKKGETSISVYGLNRNELIEARREYLNNLRNNIFIAHLDWETMAVEVKQSTLEAFNLKEVEMKELIDKARNYLAKAEADDSPYAFMAREALKKQ